MAGIRDVIMYAYFGVNLNVIWNTANERLPELKRDIQKNWKKKTQNRASLKYPEFIRFFLPDKVYGQ